MGTFFRRTRETFVGDEENRRSRRAVEKIGGVCIGTRIDGKRQERVVYAIDADSWRRRTGSSAQAQG